MIIRAILATSLALAAAACVATHPANIDCGGEECVAIGEKFDSGGAIVTPVEVLEDSRCPADAECIWAGRIKIRALLERDGRERQVEIEEGQTLPALSGNLTLTRVWPETSAASGAVASEAYRFQFSWAPIMLDAQL